MSQSTTAPLILDLLAWLAKEPRPYGEVMDAWRTSCPRLTIWEDALEQGLVVRRREAGREATVALTRIGASLLEEAAGGAPAR